MHIAEVVTIAKSLPLLRLNTYKSLILSYSADYRRIFYKKYYDTWAFEAKAGVGYFNYKESATGVSGSMSGLGYNLHLGIEYLVAEHVGIGASIGYIEGSLPEQREATEHNKRTGMSTLNIGAGVRFHF